jgi:hypothetical protein
LPRINSLLTAMTARNFFTEESSPKSHITGSVPDLRNRGQLQAIFPTIIKFGSGGHRQTRDIYPEYKPESKHDGNLEENRSKCAHAEKSGGKSGFADLCHEKVSI